MPWRETGTALPDDGGTDPPLPGRLPEDGGAVRAPLRADPEGHRLLRGDPAQTRVPLPRRARQGPADPRAEGPRGGPEAAHARVLPRPRGLEAGDGHQGPPPGPGRPRGGGRGGGREVAP